MEHRHRHKQPTPISTSDQEKTTKERGDRKKYATYGQPCYQMKGCSSNCVNADPVVFGSLTFGHRESAVTTAIRLNGSLTSCKHSSYLLLCKLSRCFVLAMAVSHVPTLSMPTCVRPPWRCLGYDWSVNRNALQ